MATSASGVLELLALAAAAAAVLLGECAPAANAMSMSSKAGARVSMAGGAASDLGPGRAGRSGSDCVGYVVSGAGFASANGCYRQPAAASSDAVAVAQSASRSGSREGPRPTTHAASSPPVFVLDDDHQLYTWNGVWKIGKMGTAVYYRAVELSAW